MKYDDLKRFITSEMRMGDGHNYQPVMILTLNQNHGEASKQKIIDELCKHNPGYSASDFNNCPVFDVLTQHNVVKFNSSTSKYELPDYDEIDTFFGRKAEITKLCYDKIENPFGIRLKEINLDELISEFREWLDTKAAILHRELIEKEKQQVKDLMEKLSTMDKSSSEFFDWVLFGLLPYGNTKYAKRISTFPVFLNIKTFLKNYNYTDEDWNKIANMIYSLARNFQKEPEKIEQWIKEFVSDKVHSRMIQCGSISPIFFCINDLYPVINNKIIRTYRDFSRAFGWGNKMSQKLENYVDNVEKCKKLIDFLNIEEVKDIAVFDLFCWWYDGIKKAKEKEGKEEGEEEEEEEEGKREFENIDFNQFLSTISLEDKKKFEPHALRNPERIKIREIIQNCYKGRWQLPNFQRYFDWKKTDIRDLLESIFRDFYIGSLLLWEVSNTKPPFKMMPIHSVKLSDDVRTDMIILDGQQRITSFYYALRPTKEPTKKIRKPVYFYINLEKFLSGVEEKPIEILEHKLSREESINKLLFPLYELENYDEWIDSFEDSLGTTSSENYGKIKDVRRVIEKKLKHFIDGFEIPYVSLPPTMELLQVTEIFERINTRGKVLNVFDILIAKLSLYSIDLRQLWDDVEAEYPKLKTYNSRDKIPVYILQSMALIYHPLSLCGKPDILEIYTNVFEKIDTPFDEAWEEMAKNVNRAILKLENLRDGYGVKNRKSLPYLPTIPILAALLKEIDERSNKVDCNSKLDMWYWASIFSENYSSGVPNVDDENVVIHLPKMGSGTYSDSDYKGKSAEFVNRDNAWTSEQISVKKGKVLCAMGYYTFTALIDMKPRPGAVYIHSASEPYNEEQEMSQERIDNWLNHFQMNKFQSHCSGHARGKDLLDAVSEIGAKTLYPIHTEHPDAYKSVSKNMVLVKEGKKYKL